MTVLLYDYHQLEEKAAKHLRVWKAWHLILYFMAIVFGISNYILLQNTMKYVDNNCILFPRKLEFHMIEKIGSPIALNDTISSLQDISLTSLGNDSTQNLDVEKENGKNITKREIQDDKTLDNFETVVEIQNVTIITENKTHHLVLDVSRTLFAPDSECQFAEYMPLMSAMCALLWATLFTMCPGGGRARTGLHQPWRILPPALVFALVLVVLTGYSFARTNSGLHQFCAAFYNLTNSTTCSSAEQFVVSGRGLGASARGARGAAGGAWAAWAAAGALLLARCLAAPDFALRTTAVHLARDPSQKVTPYLKKSKSQRRSAQSSPAPQSLSISCNDAQHTHTQETALSSLNSPNTQTHMIEIA